MLRPVRDPYDVIVIGGGFAGVTAARECAKAGLRTVVLEARERLGGRTHTTVWNGSLTELGGTWVHRRQPYVWAEIERYGLALADSNAGTTGQVVLRRSDGDIAPVDFAVQAVKILGAVAQYMGASSEMFPLPHRPFETGLAEKHDRVTAADPLADIADPFARDFLDAFVATAVGNRAREAAWVEMVRWYALAGHNYFDLVEALARYRFRDGTVALIDAMVADGKPEVRLGVAVASVEQDGARARVTSRAGEALEARAVISTLPLNVLCDVRFDPPLDPRKLEASTQRHAGASTKLHVVIEGEQRVSCLAPSENPLNSLATHHVGNGRTHSDRLRSEPGAAGHRRPAAGRGRGAPSASRGARARLDGLGLERGRVRARHLVHAAARTVLAPPRRAPAARGSGVLRERGLGQRLARQHRRCDRAGSRGRTPGARAPCVSE